MFQIYSSISNNSSKVLSIKLSDLFIFKFNTCLLLSTSYFYGKSAFNYFLLFISSFGMSMMLLNMPLSSFCFISYKSCFLDMGCTCNYCDKFYFSFSRSLICLCAS